MTLEEAEAAVEALVAWSADAFPGASITALEKLQRESIRLDVRAGTCIETMDREVGNVDSTNG